MARGADRRSLKGCHRHTWNWHLMPVDYDLWHGLRNLWKRRNLCWNSAHMGAGHGELIGGIMQIWEPRLQHLSRGRRGSHGSHPARAHLYLLAWVVATASVSALPHVKPHVGI